MEKEHEKATQRRKDIGQAKVNPVMFCSSSKTNKESLVHWCEGIAFVSSVSLSQTKQTKAFETFIARKVNPRTDSENITNYSQSFLLTPTRFIRQTTFHPEVSVNLNNHVFTLSKILSHSRSTINSNLNEPERSVLRCTSWYFFSKGTILFWLTLTSAKIQHWQKHRFVGKCAGLSLTYSQNLENQCTKIIKAVFHIRQIFRNVYFHKNLHCWICIFRYLQLSAIGLYQPHSPLMLDHHKIFLHSLGIQI